MSPGNILYSISILVLFLAGCSHPQKTQTGQKDSSVVKVNNADTTYVIERSKPITKDNPLWTAINPVTVAKCPVFAAMDTSKKPIVVLPAYTPLNIIAQNEIMRTDSVRQADSTVMAVPYYEYWYKIKLPDARMGYIRDLPIALFTLTDTARNIMYIIASTKKGKDNETIYRVQKYDLTTKKVLARLDIARNNEGYQMIYEIKNIPLKGVQFMLKIDEHMDYCGGGYASQIVADTGTGLTALPAIYGSYDDGGGIYDKILYVPVKAKNGTIKLLAGADATTGDWKVKTITAPKDITIPTDELLIETLEEGQSKLDKNDEPMVTKKGDYVLGAFSRTTSYYRWDGGKAVLLKKVKVKVK